MKNEQQVFKLNLNMSLIILNVNGVNPFEWQKFSECIKAWTNYVVSVGISPQFKWYR